ncbi:MAG: Hpt domain-containing protein [Pseudomonadota bacterium]
MSNDQEHFALDWIKSDLLETLDGARTALEAFNDARDDETRLRTCLTALHQVHGTLVMLELNGVGRLAEHLEKLAQAMMNGSTPVNDAPIQTLMQGMLELPGYLEEIQNGMADSEEPLIPLINQARRYLGLELLVEPPQNPLDGQTPEAALQRFERIDGLAKARKIRSAYQQVLLAILKGEERAQAVSVLGKVAQGLRRICEGTAHEAQWEAFGEFVAALGRKSGPLDADAIKLLRRTDAEIRSLATEGLEALRRPVNRALVQLLLDQAEHREHRSEAISNLRTALDADRPVDGLVISGRQALASAAFALREDIGALKDQIDVNVRGGAVTRDSLAALVEPLTRVGSTLNLLGFQSSHASVQDQIEAISDSLMTGEFDLPTLQNVAGTLLQVDETLASATRGGRSQGEVERITTEAHLAVAREARAGLDTVKQAIVEYVSSNWDFEKLAAVPTTLESVCGALDMVPLARPARQLGDCRALILDDLKHASPGWEALDHLADAISGVDYYLERLIDDSAAKVENVLDMVDRSLADFRDAMSAAAAETRENSETEATAGDAGAVELTIGEASSAELAEQTLDDLLADASEDFTISEPGPTRQLEAADNQPLERGAGETQKALDVVDSFPDDADIAEIFVEEAGEVLQEMDAQFAPLHSDPAASEPLGIMRRAFHTLKGSGRMVGANTIGELAWAIEQSFNQVLDGQRVASAELIELAQRARQLVPELVHCFEHREPAPQAAVVALIDQAEALRDGRAVDLASTAANVDGLSQTDLDALAAEDLLPPVTPENLIDLDGLATPADSADEQRSEDASGEPLGYEDLNLLPVDEALAASDDAVADTGLTEDELSAVDLEDELLSVADADADADAESAADESLLIFADEAREHLDTLRASLIGDRFDANENALLALHTLAGSAAIAGATTIADLARPAYDLGSAVRTQRSLESDAQAQVASFMHRYVDALAADVESLSHGETVTERSELVAEAGSLLGALDQANPAHQLLSIEGLSTLFDAGDYLRQWQQGSQDLSFAGDLDHTLRGLAEQAMAVEQPALADFASALRAAHEQYSDLELPADVHSTFDLAHDVLLKHLDAVVAEQDPPSLEASARALKALMAVAAPPTEVGDAVEWSTPSETETSHNAVDESEAESEAAFEPVPDVADGPDGPVAAEEPGSALVDDIDEQDAEIVAIFVEEAEEILESFDDSIAALRREPENQLHVENMLRSLHTLKGGARLAGLMALGQRTHELESDLIDRQQQGFNASDSAFLAALQQQLDGLTSDVGQVARRVQGLEAEAPASDTPPVSDSAPSDDDRVEADTDLELAGQAPVDESAERDAATGADVEALDDVAEQPEYEVADAAPASETPTTSVDDQISGVPDPLAMSAAASNDDQHVAQPPATTTAKPANRDDAPRQLPDRSPQEVVRVGALVLEQLVNLAGESSILRARIEQGLGDFTGALDEMETTIGRVREQLRRLEIETEAQVLYRRERVEDISNDEFDPLEMDRYSQLQQLSRSLTESASDMLDLKETLLYKARESETLLLQQARINTELQEGLMRTRMVPFSRLLPRLRRIVRQVASELDKSVEFHAYNAEGELDRSLLERMIPPLEHMLRNAVDHGIESQTARQSYGKPDSGQIELRLSREGGDVLIEIADDGAGIDVESVRTKAIERGLMASDADLRDDEVLQFVLAPGFSTAKSVTQISGRGVGMDVVNSEVKQLGGTVSIASNPGKGTRISLRIPFTVSVNRALMVSVGEDLYAIPLNTIEGIVLLGPQELEKLYAAGSKPFEYAGISYQVRYLGHYLGREYRGNPSQASAPVVLVRAGDQSVAIHVDAVQGSREIVVKSLGPQFAGVGGISGATILGDGSVVVILDLLALIRLRAQQGRSAPRRTMAAANRARCVMVVDDSVTVRKVTSRLLERQGMDVVVAKDGVEAVALLQERRPDIMLLDIEMPRMDGFEVARQVRHDDQLDGLPIVMISSRTGEKHQERATELGVDRFLGKPFQESELLETIDQLVQS